MTKYPENFVIYKAKKDGNGAASQWGLSSQRDSVFLEMSVQSGKDSNGNARFDWDNKLIFKLGITDIGEILAVLVGLKEAVGPCDIKTKKSKGLYHQNKAGNAVLYFGKDSNKRLRIYLSVKRENDEKNVVQHSISEGESCVLSTLLRRAIEVMYLWN